MVLQLVLDLLVHRRGQARRAMSRLLLEFQGWRILRMVAAIALYLQEPVFVVWVLVRMALAKKALVVENRHP